VALFAAPRMLRLLLASLASARALEAGAQQPAAFGVQPMLALSPRLVVVRSSRVLQLDVGVPRALRTSRVVAALRCDVRVARRGVCVLNENDSERLVQKQLQRRGICERAS
jgi:hypothetical protein